MKKLLSMLLLVLLTATAINGCGSSEIYRTLSDIEKSGYINIGVYNNKEPFGYLNENDELTGYDIELANRVAEDLGVTANLIPVNINERLTTLEDGKCDIVIANFTVTPERAERVDFALPYMKTSLGLLCRQDNVITSLSEIAENEPIIALKGTAGETYLKNNYPNLKIMSYGSREDGTNAFYEYTAVAFVNDNTDVIMMASENPEFVVGIPAFGDVDTIAPAVTKGNETLLSWLNDEIRTLRNEKFFHQAYSDTLASTFGEDNADSLVIDAE